MPSKEWFLLRATSLRCRLCMYAGPLATPIPREKCRKLLLDVTMQQVSPMAKLVQEFRCKPAYHVACEPATLTYLRSNESNEVTVSA
jgi:hypothetical protein